MYSTISNSVSSLHCVGCASEGFPPQHLAQWLCSHIKSWKAFQGLFSSFFFYMRVFSTTGILSLVWRERGVKVCWELLRVWTVGFSSTICISCIFWKEVSWSITCSCSIWMSLGFFLNFVDLSSQILAVVLYKVEIYCLEKVVWYRSEIRGALLGLCVNCFPVAAARENKKIYF